MTQPYWRPKFRPREGEGKGLNILGLRRHTPINEWKAHAFEEHNWDSRHEADGMPDINNCATCKELYEQLQNSEKWT